MSRNWIGRSKYFYEMESPFKDVVATGLGARAPSKDLDEDEIYKNEASNMNTPIEGYNDIEDMGEENGVQRRFDEEGLDNLNNELGPSGVEKQNKRKG